MKETYAAAGPKIDHALRRQVVTQLCRDRWALEIRNIALESELREQRAQNRELQERLTRIDYQQRELLKGLASIVDDCDDALHVESLLERVNSTNTTIAAPSKNWRRRLERIRNSLMARLTAYGVSVRTPSGTPRADLDAIHSVTEAADVPPGEVVCVLQPGLLWNGSVLRSSQVTVAAPNPTRANSGPTST